MAASYFTPIKALAIAQIKRTFRDKTALFFTFLFPLMFLLIFGALNRGGDDISFDVAILNRSDTAFSARFIDQVKNTESLTVHDGVTDLDEAREKMSQGDLDSVLEIPEGFGTPNDAGVPAGTLTVYYDEGSPQSGQTVAAIFQGVFDGMNRELTGIQPPLQIAAKSTATGGLSSFDYVFSGLLGFSFLSLGVFGMANNFPAEKKVGSFRRLRVAPINASHLIFATAINYLVIGLLSSAVMVAAALLVFDFQMRGSYLDLLAFSTLGILMMFGFGLAIGGWAKNDAQAAPLSNLVAFPMMFLSGVFFPRFLMPEWLQAVTRYIPLTPIVDGIRGITAEGKALLDLGPELGLIAVWIVVIYVVAIRLFRWE